MLKLREGVDVLCRLLLLLDISTGEARAMRGAVVKVQRSDRWALKAGVNNEHRL